MKEKLTKNDSMSNKNADFDVFVALFENFLNKENAHAIYFQEWEKAKDYSGTANVFYGWREWAKKIHPSGWISGAFIWCRTEKDYFYWYAKNIMWRALYLSNFKK